MRSPGEADSGSVSVLGIVLIALGVGAVLIAGLWLGTSYVSGNLTAPALALGLGLALLIAGPVAGAGVLLLSKGRRESRLRAAARKERRLLGLVRTQGQVNLDDVAIELDASRDQVKAWVYDLVDKGLFAGYTDWREGILYSRDAAQLRRGRCPNCGGALELAGKGTISCPYCDAEIFLTE